MFKFDKKVSVDFSDPKGERLVSTPVMVASNWSQEFQLMCDANDYVVGAVLGQHRGCVSFDLLCQQGPK